MKTKLKQTKGITLIALIITIIILLILAMVTIRILMNQGIIKHAEKATAAYSAAQSNETEYLTYTEGEMDKYAGGRGSGATETGWKDNGDGTISKGTVTVQIGDYINYDCYTGVASDKLYYKTLSFGFGDQEFEVTSNPSWKILGISDSGNILITTSNPVLTKNESKFLLYGKKGYVNGPDELDAISQIFGHGAYAAGARSMTVEDVNKITRYTPPAPERYTYTKSTTDGKIYRNGYTGSSTSSSFWYHENDNPKGEWKQLEVGETSPEITDTTYGYTIATSNKGQKMLCYEDDKSTQANFWLASRAVCCYDTGAIFRLCAVMNGQLNSYNLYYSTLTEQDISKGVRPVVTLASDVQLEYDSTNNIWKIK